MHPNPLFRNEDRALHESLVEEIGFGMVFAQVPDGPRVAHTALLSTGDGAVQFHLSRGNALTKHLAGHDALLVVNGPDAYVSPRWYADPAQVPTWNYVALELEGPVRRMDEDGLVALLDGLSARQEARIEGAPWTRAKMDETKFRKMLTGIAGFEMEVRAWRPTFKLSQNKSPEDRAAVIAALEAQGAPGMAALMRSLAE
ncbi:FMN-binding negative transcriptional regulator [Croceibacterium aestuarii]|uniref:FMN-binding negative transcriptional regulator n=1 Tax=Croceibacterium aestuarii TaxID=3064139 RepID=UPI00272ED192|nr:FMN-binding negative transcriptional regulator [Croceibacterium sp. D39]